MGVTLQGEHYPVRIRNNVPEAKREYSLTVRRALHFITASGEASVPSTQLHHSKQQ